MPAFQGFLINNNNNADKYNLEKGRSILTNLKFLKNEQAIIVLTFGQG